MTRFVHHRYHRQAHGAGACCLAACLGAAPLGAVQVEGLPRHRTAPAVPTPSLHSAGYNRHCLLCELSTDERTPLVTAYANAVAAWSNSTAAAFLYSPQRNFTVSVNPLSTAMAPVAESLYLPPSTSSDPSACKDPEGCGASPSTFANYQFAGSVSTPMYVLPGDLSTSIQVRRTNSLRIAARHVSVAAPRCVADPQVVLTTTTPGSAARLLSSLTLPVWRIVTYSQSCSTSCTGSGSSRRCSTTCRCEGSGHSNSDGSCSLWFQLVEVCLVVDPGAAAAGADAISNPPGCALVGSQQVWRHADSGS